MPSIVDVCDYVGEISAEILLWGLPKDQEVIDDFYDRVRALGETIKVEHGLRFNHAESVPKYMKLRPNSAELFQLLQTFVSQEMKKAAP